MREIGCSLTRCWLRPSSPESRIFSSSRDQRLRRRVMDRENADRLAAHPVLVETQDGVDGRAALNAIANHDDQIFRGIGPDRARLRREAFQELGDRLHRDMLQGDHRNPIAGFRNMACVGAIGMAAADGVISRNDPVAACIMHQDRVARAQGAFKNKQQLRFRNRTPRREAYGPLNARIDHIAHPEIIAQNDLRHGAQGSILEVQGDAIASCRAPPPTGGGPRWRPVPEPWVPEPP